MSSTTPSIRAPTSIPFLALLSEFTKRKTGKDITSHPLAAEIEACHSPDAILTVLQSQISASGQSKVATKGLQNGLSQLSMYSTRFRLPSARVLD